MLQKEIKALADEQAKALHITAVEYISRLITQGVVLLPVTPDNTVEPLPVGACMPLSVTLTIPDIEAQVLANIKDGMKTRMIVDRCFNGDYGLAYTSITGFKSFESLTKGGCTTETGRSLQKLADNVKTQKSRLKKKDPIQN